MRLLRAGLIVFLALLCIPRTIHAQVQIPMVSDAIEQWSEPLDLK